MAKHYELKASCGKKLHDDFEDLSIRLNIPMAELLRASARQYIDANEPEDEKR
jgi:hypothetical protein